MKRRGKGADEAWEICHEAIVARMDKYPAWKAWLLGKLMFSRTMKRRVGKRAANGDQLRFGDFEVRYLVGDGESFDWGVDYVGCGNYEFMKQQGAATRARVSCRTSVCSLELLLEPVLGKRTAWLFPSC